jgi:hypothetical protein
VKRHFTDEERSIFFSRLLTVVVAVGLLYVASSVAIMYHLVQENNQTCEFRRTTIDAAREYLIFVDDEFTVKDQALLDELFPKLVC